MATLSTERPGTRCVSACSTIWRCARWSRGPSTITSAVFVHSRPSSGAGPPATAEDVRRFQLHQPEHGAGVAVISAAVSALRFLFTVTLERPDLSRRLVLAARHRKLPDVLSVEEVGADARTPAGARYTSQKQTLGLSVALPTVCHLFR